MYIERDKLLRQLEIVPSYGRYIDIETVEGLVRDMPAADVVEVVRCKDCKHYHEGQGWCDKHSYIDPQGDWEMFYEDDYCSCGESK